MSLTFTDPSITRRVSPRCPPATGSKPWHSSGFTETTGTNRGGAIATRSHVPFDAGGLLGTEAPRQEIGDQVSHMIAHDDSSSAISRARRMQRLTLARRDDSARPISRLSSA